MLADSFHAALSLSIIFIYWLFVAGVSLRILFKRRATSFVVSWLLIIYVIPFVGVITYLLIGEQYIGRQRSTRAKEIWTSYSKILAHFKEYDFLFNHNVSVTAEPLFQLCTNRLGLSGIQGNHIALYSSTEETFLQLIDDINVAQENIDMIFYIWHPHGVAQEVAEAFICAAKRGVKCRLILDAAGSREFFRSQYSKIMQQAGINVVEALKVNFTRMIFRRLDLRQHRKLIVIDHEIAYTGSMNLIDPASFKANSGVGQWVDVMLRINGPAAYFMGIIFNSDWQMETGDKKLPERKNNFTPITSESNTLQIVPSGPGFFGDIISQSLLTAIYSARRQLILTTPYFVPSDELLRAICTTSQRGVEVMIILPYKNDSIMVKWACRAFFNELLEAGVKIFGYTGGLLHTKSVCIDGQLSLIGTVNLDIRSLTLNFELTTIIDDANFTRKIVALQQEYIKNAFQVDIKKWHNRSWLHRILERFFYFFSPLL